MAEFSHKDYQSNPFLATSEIGKLLNSGCLNLFLGAGVSCGFGLPKWTVLIARMLGKENDPAYLDELDGKSDRDLAILVDPLDDESANYIATLHRSLYRSVKSDLPERLSQSPLLLAVAALITGSSRGRISRVFTYNYDDLLEQYLSMLGYAVCKRSNPFDFSTRADVEINHVHGYLPQAWKIGDSIPRPILSEKSYRAMRAEIDKGWPASVAHSFYSRVGLYIGVSGDDSVMLDIVERARKSINRVGGIDYHGYWLMTPRAYARNVKLITGIDMCPIPIEEGQFPKFVFEICQKALLG